MATLQERIETATDVLETDAGLMHSIIHGGSTETVETEGGPIPTVAKQVADLEASYAAIDAVAAVAADRQAAETARGGAEDARDVAVAATANMLVKGNNLSDVPDAAAARDNLGVTEALTAVGNDLAELANDIQGVSARTAVLENKEWYGSLASLNSLSMVELSDIPGDVKKISILIKRVQQGTNLVLRGVQLGTSDGYETSGYFGTCGYIGPDYAYANSSSSFILPGNGSANVYSGSIELKRFGPNDVWVISGIMGLSSSTHIFFLSGDKTLLKPLTRLKFFVGGGVFTSGTIQFSWEK